jgi:predicted DNA-binding transcriptional regulator YafY
LDHKTRAVRAGRLVSLLLLLQVAWPDDGGGVGGGAGGVRPEAGRDGGYQLLGGYPTRLTGLTGDEAAALSMVAMPQLAVDLGLGAAAAAAGVKIRAALRDALRQRADHVQRRLLGRSASGDPQV